MLLFYLSAIPDEKQKGRFRSLYDKYAGLMLYAAKQLTDDDKIAEDIVHETFLRIIDKIDIIRTETEDETTAFIYTLTRYCGVDYLRKNKMMPLADDDNTLEYYTTAHDEEQRMIDAVYINDIVEIIEKMDEKYSMPLQLKVNGYKISEIAQLLNISEETVKVRIHRARKMIIERLEGK